MKRFCLFAVAVLAGCSTATAISDDISKACTDALPAIAAAAPFVSGNPVAAGAVASVQAACTIDGQVQMTLNDAAPVTATNSGNSAAWVAATKAFVQGVAAAAIVTSPAVSK